MATYSAGIGWRATAGAGWLSQPWCGTLRAGLQTAVLFPALRTLCPLTVRGGERLAGLSGPVLITPNHSSHLDTLAVLAALPAAWRRRTAVAAAADYFFSQPLLAATVGLLVNGFPFQRSGGAAASLRTCRGLTADGWSLLLFPEGTRSPDGRIGPFRPGIGWLATHLGLPVVPVHLAGLVNVLPKGARWPRPGRVGVTFGAPLRLTADLSPAGATALIEAAVRGLAATVDAGPADQSTPMASGGPAATTAWEVGDGAAG